jgi:hypothetical protein
MRLGVRPYISAMVVSAGTKIQLCIGVRRCSGKSDLFDADLCEHVNQARAVGHICC